MKKVGLFLWDILVGESPLLAISATVLLWLAWILNFTRIGSVIVLVIGVPCVMILNIAIEAVKKRRV